MSFHSGRKRIRLKSFFGELNYAGVYTARNTTVTFSDVNLEIERPVEPSDWSFSAFGSNTSEGRNPMPAIGDDGSVRLTASGGKVASDDEGLSFYYQKLPAHANFEIKAEATVHHFNGDPAISTPNQKSFGVMLRNQVGEHGDSSTQTSEYVAVGALDTVMKAFYKQGGEQVKGEPFPGQNDPAPGEVYELSIRKSGRRMPFP